MSWNPFLSASKNRSEGRKRPDSMTGFRRTIAPADAITLRCNHSTSHVNEKRAAARHWNSRQRENLSILATKTVHQRQYFRKFRVFKISVSWTTVAWSGITFSFRNAQSWYFQKTKPQTLCSCMIWRISWDPFVSTPKIRSKDRKGPDPTTSFRREIAPADAITLRCNHSTNHFRNFWSNHPRRPKTIFHANM